MDTLGKSYNTGTDMETLPQSYVTEDKILLPLTEVLEQVTPRATADHVPIKDISVSLDALFPEQQRQDKELQKAKQILGKYAKNFSESELKDVMSEIKFLTESWLDDFERDIFAGKTLKELLHERSSK